MRSAALMFSNLVAFSVLAQSAEPIDDLNQALAASENLAIAAAQSSDPVLADAARRAHLQFLQSSGDPDGFLRHGP